MKKFIFLLLSIIFVSCNMQEQRDELRSEVNTLKHEQKILAESILNLGEVKGKLSKDVQNLRIEKSAFESNSEPVYLLTLEIKQSTFTLNLAEHAKNAINAITLQIPVSYTFYNKVSIGQNISEEFKYGSLILNGDFSKLKVKVKNKEIKRMT